LGCTPLACRNSKTSPPNLVVPVKQDGPVGTRKRQSLT
jgi:hypothetical protein